MTVDGSRFVLPVLIVILVTTGGFWLLRSERASGAPAAAAKRSPRPPATASESDSGTSNATRPSARETSGAPVQETRDAVELPPHDTGIQVGEPGAFSVTSPTIEEVTDPSLMPLFAIWRSEPVDPVVTEKYAALLAAELEEHELHPLAYHLRCGSSLCRVRIRFERLKDLHRMRDIEPPEGVQVVTTFPQRWTKDYVDASIYWPSDGQSLERIRAAYARGTASESPNRPPD